MYQEAQRIFWQDIRNAYDDSDAFKSYLDATDYAETMDLYDENDEL